MPPKRRAKKDEAPAASDPPTDSSATSDVSPPKKLKVDKQDEIAPTTTSDTSNSGSISSTIDEEDDDRPKCVYWDKCYRKNPQHFKDSSITSSSSEDKQNSKPKPVVTKSSNKVEETTTTTTSTSTNLPMDSTLESYKSILHITLAKSKITTDEKRLLRQYRKKHSISDDVHFKMLKLFGWTEEEYDDGVKQDDDIELEEETDILEKDDGFQIIRITKQDANKSKAHSNVFSKVCTKFYETMSKAQANFTVAEVGVIVNTKLKRQYQAKKLALSARDGEDTKEEWGFHGTTHDSILKIAATGFLHPDELKKLKEQNSSNSKGKGKGKKKKAMKEKPVELLDDGYFGKGIYFTTFSDYALWYSSERESDQVLLSKLLPGKPFKCFKRMDGLGCQPGYDSHTSPKGNEVVLFESQQILPRYIITFVEKEASEREQES